MLQIIHKNPNRNATHFNPTLPLCLKPQKDSLLLLQHLVEAVFSLDYSDYLYITIVYSEYCTKLKINNC